MRLLLAAVTAVSLAGCGGGDAPTLSGDALAGAPGSSCEPDRIEPASRITTLTLDGPGVSQRLGVVVVAEDQARCVDMGEGYRCTFVGPGEVFVIRDEESHVYRFDAAGGHLLETSAAGVYCVASDP